MAWLPQRCHTLTSFFNGTNTDLARTSTAAVETTWLSPRFDGMNVLSKAIKVSPLFARRDGWCFDDHDEKQYIDPERTVIPVVWQIFTWAVCFTRFIIGRMDSFSCFLGRWVNNIWYWCLLWANYGEGIVWHTAMRPLWGFQAGEKGIFNLHPDWLQTYTPKCSFKGEGHFLKASPM